jgi:glycosyltransferase involved in cell wall biosynthesis
MSTPSIGVFIPAFNAAPYIAEAIESVLAQLPGDAEVVVVDDGSTDATAAVAARFGSPVRVVGVPHGGIASAINAAIAEMRAPILASIDADDRWLPGKLEKQLAALAAEPSLDAVFGFVRQFVSPDLPAARAAQMVFSGQPIAGFMRGAMLIRRAAYDRVGPMETDLKVGEFISWYSRGVDAGLKGKLLPDLVYERRIHGANTVLLERDARSDYLRIVKATLDRRRAARSAE